MNGTDRRPQRRWMTGVGSGLLMIAALVIVGAGAYRAGERSDHDRAIVSEVVGEGDSDGRTIVVDDGWDRGGPGFFPGFLVFPLIIGGIVFLVVSRRRRWCGGPYGDTHGQYWLEDWHRRAHEAESSPSSTTPPPSTPTDDS